MGVFMEVREEEREGPLDGVWEEPRTIEEKERH